MIRGEASWLRSTDVRRRKIDRGTCGEERARRPLSGRALSPRAAVDNICERSAADDVAAPTGWSHRSAVVPRSPASIARVPVVVATEKKTPLPRPSCAPLRVVFTSVTVVVLVRQSILVYGQSVLLCVSQRTTRRRMAKIVFSPSTSSPQRDTAAFPSSTDCRPHHRRRSEALGGVQRRPLFSSRLPSTGLRFVFRFFR